MKYAGSIFEETLPAVPRRGYSHRKASELENLPLIRILEFEERAISKRIPLAGT